MKIIKFDNGRYSEPPICRPIAPPGVPVANCAPLKCGEHRPRHTVSFQNYEIPQFTLHLNLRPPGNRMPREEANITGRIKYILQLNGLRGDRG